MADAVEEFYKAKHFTQLDPDPSKTLSAEHLEDRLGLAKSYGTDAVIVAGTQNITAKDLLNCTFAALDTGLPVYVGPSSPEQVSSELLEAVLSESAAAFVLYHPENAQNPKYINKPHAEFEKMLYDEGIDLEGKRIDVAYIILNRKSAVGVLTKPDLNRQRMVGYALSAARKYPVVYLEGSGKFVSEEILKEISEPFFQQDTHLLVGGGIVSKELAEIALSYADAIIVGNIFEQDLEAYRETISALKFEK